MQKLFTAVDNNRELILNALDYIWKNPETGFKEFKTTKYLEDAFEKLEYDLVKAGDIPGFYTVIDTGKPGPELLILGELDSLICPEHPEADKETGAVHCCGHAAQSAALLGIAAALKAEGALDGICGKIRLCAVPAEELIEIEYRSNLRERGIIKYMGGKTEFLSRGYFDGVDLAFMVHTTSGENFIVRKGSVGCLAKKVIYKGVSSHAGGSPWNGCNALYASTLGLSAINSIRETFKEDDIIRVHPIITEGGAVVNAIPDRVTLESFVRGKTYDGIVAANKRVNKALCGAALSLGANIDIIDYPGYAPLVNDETLMIVARDAAELVTGKPAEYSHAIGSGSTDMGDLSMIMPAIHPYAPGASGKSHGSDYVIFNPDLACVGSAKWQLAMLYMLLSDDAKLAKQAIADFKPTFASKEDYLSYIDSLNSNGDRIVYNGDTATVTL